MTTFANMLPAEIREPGTLKLLLPACETGARPGSFFLAKKESPLSSSADLKGHTLGTYSGASQKVYTLAILTRLGLREPEDVKLQQVQTSAQVQALFGGAFDVLFAVEPYASMAMAQGAKVIESGVRMKPPGSFLDWFSGVDNAVLEKESRSQTSFDGCSGKGCPFYRGTRK